jgi:predicted urease superfamily metal-dependent hydrolase
MTLLGLVYFVQTNFLDDFYKAHKMSSIESVARTVSEIVGEDDVADQIEHISMSNEVCVRVVSNVEE